MIKVKKFTEYNVEIGTEVTAYQKFINDNQHIEIISVNITKNGFILLTYKEGVR